jgi:acetyl-CoA carboxylase biotin carboxyl carrier protein
MVRGIKGMDFKEIQELIKIVDESNLTTVEVEKDGFKIVLKKKIEQIVYKETMPANQSFVDRSALEREPIVSPRESVQTEEHETINSPIVGTFFSSSAPGEEPFVRSGSKVNQGNTLCIIEAMKLMNEIEAEEDLEIIEVLAQDGQMVEYGQPLFTIRKAI